MKKLIKLTLVVALVLGSSSLFAQKLGRINLEEIITLMPEYKEMMTNMEAYSKDLRDNLETIQVELNTKYNDFQKNKATYSEVTRQLKEKELTDLQNRLQEFYQSAQDDCRKREGTDRSDRRQSTGSGQESGAKGGLRRRIQYDHSLDGLLRRSGHDRFEHRSQGRARNSINGNASTTKSVRFEIRSGRFISSKSPFRAAEIRGIQHILPLPTRTPCRRIILARQRLHTQPRPPQ